MFATFQKNPAQSPKLNTAGASVRLQKNQSLEIDGAIGWTVTALSGTVWITQDRDVRDVVLDAGQSFVLDRNKSALIWSLATSEICVTRDAGNRTSTGRKAERTAQPARTPGQFSFA